MSLRTTAAFLFALSTALAAGAQGPPPPPRMAADQQKRTDGAYTIDLRKTQVRFDNDGKSRRELTMSVKVLDEAGVRAFGEIPLPYEFGTDALDVKSVQVQKPDGSLVSAAAGDVRDITMDAARIDPVLTDVHAKVISVSALRPGDTLRVDAVWTTTDPVAPRQFWFEYSFDRTQPVQDEELEIDVPADRTVALRIAPGAPAEENGGSGKVNGDRRIYRWKTSHAVDAPPAKAPAPGLDRPAPDVRLSSFANWDEVAAWYAGLAAPSKDADVRAKAAALTADAADDAAKIAAIYRFVSTQIRYVSLQFGLRRFAAHPPSEVLKKQYGDCKDKAVLLVSLLEAAGIKAVPVLLNTQRSIDDDFASPAEFDHMVALIPGATDPARGMWMDSTLEVAPIGMLAQPTRDKRVLAIQDAKGVLLRTPSDPPFQSFEHVDVTGTVNAIGALAGRVDVTMRGDGELALRIVVRAIPGSRLKDLVTKFAAGLGMSETPSDVETSDPADTTQPFRISFRFRHPGYLDWAAKDSTITPLAKIGVPFGSDADRKDLESIPAGGPGEARVTESLDFPAAYRVDPPPSTNLTRLGFTYQSTYRVDAHHLTVQYVTDYPAGRIASARFNEYASFASGVEDDLARTVAVHGDVSSVPDAPPDATPSELYSAAFNAYSADRYDTAAALWTRETELDPKQFDAWDSLGLAYQKLHKYDDAVASIQKAIALDAYNKRIYGDLASVLKDEGKREDAAKAYLKHIELNPTDGAALRDLGELYDDMERYADAAPLLEKAAGILKPDAWLYAVLGVDYVELKQNQKALAALDHALSIEKTPAVETKVAWALAAGGMQLDRAEALARASEQELVTRLATVDLNSVGSGQLGDVETLAWDWDDIGWAAFQKGNTTDAEKYARAAWQILGKASIAFHLGQIYEKRDRLADALSFDLTAQALWGDAPPPEIMAHIKKFSGGGDLPLMLASAKQMAPSDRVIKFAQKAPAGSAEFLAIVGSDRKAADVKFLGGSDALRPLVDAFKQATYPVMLPDNPSTRIVIAVRAKCDASVCRAIVDYPDHVKLNR